MIKEIVFAKLKEYGASLFNTHGKVDIETLHGIAQHKINSMKGTMSKVVLGELLNGTKQYLDKKLVKKEECKDREVINASFTVTTKKT
jgi:hypothetical protein